jgi:hypothetical protein
LIFFWEGGIRLVVESEGGGIGFEGLKVWGGWKKFDGSLQRMRISRESQSFQECLELIWGWWSHVYKTTHLPSWVAFSVVGGFLEIRPYKKWIIDLISSWVLTVGWCEKIMTIHAWGYEEYCKLCYWKNKTQTG